MTCISLGSLSLSLTTTENLEKYDQTFQNMKIFAEILPQFDRNYEPKYDQYDQLVPKIFGPTPHPPPGTSWS